MQLQIKNEISKLTDQINSVASISSIYLFGSFAYGTPDDDSDLDLCIVTREEDMRKRELIKIIRKSITQVATMPVDILVYYKDEFYDKAALESTIEYKIVSEGVNVYEN